MSGNDHHEPSPSDQNLEEPIEDQEDELDVDESDQDEPEFSLSQLSEAYASVIEKRTGVRPVVAAEPAPTDPLDDSEVPHASDDNAACPISPESIIEAILFIGAPRDVKLTSRKVAAVLRDVSPKEVTSIVRQLNEKYEQENAAFRIKSDGGVFEMVLDPALNDFQQEFYGRNKQVRLSQAAIDVMAIVAYNQPTTREQVDKVRGKPSGAVLSQLVRRQLLIVERGKENSKVRYYSTTDRFLDLFQLEAISDLPQSHDVSDIAELAD
ncbi:MAG: SMC-Scp complex subunit ScpB [Planctomycetota bacterium]